MSGPRAHAHPECPGPDFRPHDHDRDARDRRDAYRALAVSAVVLLGAGGVELAVSMLSGSAGLLGDAFHNLADGATSAAVFVGLRYSRRPANAAHPYGWDRAEDVAGLGVAALIWASAAFALVVSVHKLMHPATPHALVAGVLAALVGALANAVVGRYKMRVGRRINSLALIADARHSWLDTLSSLAALAGLVAAGLGAPYADGIAGLAITGLVLHVGFDVTRSLLSRLSDGVDPSVVARCVALADSVEGVRHAHARARWTGRCLLVEVEGVLDPSIPLRRAEEIGESVRDAVRRELPDVKEVTWLPRVSLLPWPESEQLGAAERG